MTSTFDEAIRGWDPHLTRTEKAFLRVLCDHAGETVDMHTLCRAVYGIEYIPSRDMGIANSHIYRIRQKLGAAVTIHTVRNEGFQLTALGDAPVPEPPTAPLTLKEIAVIMEAAFANVRRERVAS